MGKEADMKLNDGSDLVRKWVFERVRSYEKKEEKLVAEIQKEFDAEKTRPVTVFKLDGYQKVKVGVGSFHQFGVSYDTSEEGIPSNFSTAIIEMSDGNVVNVPVHLIKFERD